MNVFNWIAQAFVKLVTSVNNLLWGDLVVLEFSNGETQFGLSLLVLVLIPVGI